MTFAPPCNLKPCSRHFIPLTLKILLNSKNMNLKLTKREKLLLSYVINDPKLALQTNAAFTPYLISLKNKINTL